MPDDGMLWLGWALAATGVALLRLSWGRSRRSARLNALGWTSLAGAGLLAGAAEGAWGIAIATVVATGTAGLFLAQAAVVKPRVTRRSPTAAKAPAMPAAEEVAPGGARVRGWLTFALAGPLALAVSVAVALAVRALAMRWSIAEADGNVMVLALVPLAWPMLAFALLMYQRRRAQIALLGLLAAASALPLLAPGMAA